MKEEKEEKTTDQTTFHGLSLKKRSEYLIKVMCAVKLFFYSKLWVSVLLE